MIFRVLDKVNSQGSMLHNVGSAISIGGSLLGSALSSKASKGSAKTLASGAQSALDLQKAQYEDSRDDLAPYRNVGSSALYQLSNLLGLAPSYTDEQQLIAGSGPLRASTQANTGGKTIYYNPYTGESSLEGGPGFIPLTSKTYQASKIGEGDPNYFTDIAGDSANLKNLYSSTGAVGGSSDFGSLARGFTMDDYQADPGYQFRLDEGNKALERTQAARGNLLSGAAVKAASTYNSGQASQEYSNAYNRFNTDQSNLFGRLSSLAGIGQSSTNTTAQLGANYANNAGDLLTSQASANAAGQVGSANAWSTGLGQIGSQFGAFGSGGNVFNEGTGRWL